MATHDYIIANADGATVRADLNDVLEAIVSNNSSSSAPATTYAFMWWADTTNGLLKLRNAADSAWVSVATLTGGSVEKTGATGSAIIPAGTEAQRDGSPSEGYLRWNTDSGSAEIYDGSAWVAVGGGATGAGGDAIFYENGQTVTSNYTITSGKNAGSFGPITINSGVTVTVPSGSTWTIA